MIDELFNRAWIGRLPKERHCPRTVMFTVDAAEGAHTLLRVSGETRAAGHAARIIQFVAN